MIANTARQNNNNRAARRSVIKLATCALASVLMTLTSSAAHAQSIDYASLEKLFGEAVTTSATGTPQRASEVPANMEIVTADDIRRSGAHDIPGVLRHILGVDVAQWTNDNSDVGLRGYNQAFSPRVLVLIDGRQVYADHYGFTPWNSLPVELSAIRQIEIVKGPNTALFGFNAVSGVINIITFNPLYDTVNTSSISGGTQGTGEASVVQTFRSDKGGLRLSAGGHLNNDFSTPVPSSMGTLLRKRGDRFAFDADGILRLTDKVQLGLEASHSGAAANYVYPVYSLSNDQQFASSVKGQVNADTGFGLVQATGYINWISQHSRNDSNVAIDFADRVSVFQLQDIFKLGSAHTFRASVEYRNNTLQTNPFVGGKVFYDNLSAGGMWEWDIAPGLELTNSARFDNLHLGRSGLTPAGYPFTNADWNLVNKEWSSNTGLVWKADDLDTFRLLASRGVQMPSLADVGGLLVITPLGKTTGSPNVQPADVVNVEINWDRGLPYIGGQFRAAVFYLRMDELFTPLGAVFPMGPSGYTISDNVGNSIGRGVELSLTGMRANWRWGVNYRYELITDKFEPFAKGGIAFFDFQHVNPKHVAKARLGWTDDKWEIDGYLYYQSATRGLAAQPFGAGSFLTPVPSYVSLDSRIAYRLTDWATFAISGQNLLESSQQQTSGPRVERRVFGTLSIQY